MWRAGRYSPLGIIMRRRTLIASGAMPSGRPGARPTRPWHTFPPQAAFVVVTAFFTLLVGACGVDPSLPDLQDPSSDEASGNESTTTDGSAFVFDGEDDPALASLGYLEGELIVQTLPGADATDLAETFSTVGAVVVEQISELDTTILAVPPEALYSSAATLAEDEQIESLQKNYLFEPAALPNDPLLEDQAYLDQIDAAGAWAITAGDARVIIAILDSGVALDHVDLRDNLLDGLNVAAGNADASDVDGHGTAVAGAAAATADNGKGIAGVAGGASILPVRVTRPDGRAAASVIAKAIVSATQYGARVINVSFGPLQTDKTVLAACQRARNNGALVFISSGNDGKRKTSKANEAALFIGAVDARGERARFSAYGPYIDFVAPGVHVLTTDIDGGYRTVNGTSFSAPIAAAVAALVWSVEPNLRPVTVEDILRSTAVDLGIRLRDNEFGYGMVDAGAAVAAATSTVVETDSVGPTASISKPASGTTVKGKFRVVAKASDKYGVADVVLSIDGEPFATDTRSPYTFVVNSRRIGVGVHTLSVVATDTSGNVSKTVNREITIGGDSDDVASPELTIVFPANGAKVSGTVEVRAIATDNDALSRLVFKVDGKSLRSSRVSGVRVEKSFFWNTSGVSSGRHTISVTATDRAGLTATDSIRLTK